MSYADTEASAAMNWEPVSGKWKQATFKEDLQLQAMAVKQWQSRREKQRELQSDLGLVRFLNQNRNRGFFKKPRKTETAIFSCICNDFLPDTLKLPMSVVRKYN